MTDLQECKQALLNAFPGGWFNERDEFIAHTRSDTYFMFCNCETPLDVECKILEWFSRPASKGQPYSQEWRNRKFREFMLNGINSFLDTNFNQESMEEIYQYLGNAINHELTVRFVESGYDFEVFSVKEKNL